MEAEDGVRETVIKRSRDVLKLSKTAIYCCHRGQRSLADSNLADALRIVKEELFPLTVEHPTLRGGSLSSALEEYSEAVLFRAYLEGGKIPSHHADGLEGVVTKEEYLGGVMDCVGEITRTAVQAATKRKEDDVARALEVVTDLQQALMGFDFRNGFLRKKFDGIKYSLNKLEQITYELSLTKSLGGIGLASHDMADAPREEGEAPADEPGESDAPKRPRGGGKGDSGAKRQKQG
jgi:predicted translin family RNA/ssDNA-binding protein